MDVPKFMPPLSLSLSLSLSSRHCAESRWVIKFSVLVNGFSRVQAGGGDDGESPVIDCLEEVLMY